MAAPEAANVRTLHRGRTPLSDPAEGTGFRPPYAPLLLGMHAVVGAFAGAVWALARTLSPEGVLVVAATGAAALPAALLMTPVSGSRWTRGFRFGISLAVILTLVSSFLTPEELRSLESLLLEFFQFLAGGFLFFVLVEPRGRPEGSEP